MKSSLFLNLCLAIQFVAKAVFVVSCILQLSVLSRTPITVTEARENDFRMEMVALAVSISFLFMLIAYYIWLFTAKKECQRLGALSVAYSPVLSIACHFVPIGNFFMPYYAVQELNQTSLEPKKWSAQPKSHLILFWWILWVAALLAGIVTAFFMSVGRGIDHLRVYTWLLIGAAVLSLWAYALLFLVVTKISRQIQSSAARALTLIPT